MIESYLKGILVVSLPFLSAACANKPQQPVPSGVKYFTAEKKNGDITIRAVDRSYLANLDGIKLTNKQGPNADDKTSFDIGIEFQGIGVQFDPNHTYGYIRADRTFTNDRRVGINIRFRF